MRSKVIVRINGKKTILGATDLSAFYLAGLNYESVFRREGHSVFMERQVLGEVSLYGTVKSGDPNAPRVEHFYIRHTTKSMGKVARICTKKLKALPSPNCPFMMNILLNNARRPVSFPDLLLYYNERCCKGKR